MFHAYKDSATTVWDSYQNLQQIDSYTFIILTKGECRVSLYTSEHTISSNNVITLLPNSYFKLIKQSNDAEFYVVSFRQTISTSSDLFMAVLDHITHIIEFPAIKLDKQAVEIVCDYIKLLIRIEEYSNMNKDREFAASILKQFIIGFGATYRINEANIMKTDRSRALVMRLIKLVVAHYPTERSPSFYADALHISPQHLSTIVRKVTRRTITDLIAQFVIIDAQTKLTSTDMSVNEIATALNFDDISTFGKYFKRYTKSSPRNYRNRNSITNSRDNQIKAIATRE